MVRVPGTCPLPERNITLVEYNCTMYKKRKKGECQLCGFIPVTRNRGIKRNSCLTKYVIALNKKNLVRTVVTDRKLTNRRTRND